MSGNDKCYEAKLTQASVAGGRGACRGCAYLGENILGTTRRPVWLEWSKAEHGTLFQGNRQRLL